MTVVDGKQGSRLRDNSRLLEIVNDIGDDAITGQERVLIAMRRAILRGVFEPGSRLRQEELARVFGTSRIPVREALRALEFEGLLESEARRGFTVASLQAEDVDEVYELRTVLEAHAVRLAIPLLTEGDLQELQALFETLRAADSEDEYLATRETFYRRLYSVSGRPRLVGLIIRLHQEVARVLRWATMEHSITFHEQFLEYICAGDADGAVAHLDEHYRRVSALLRRRIREAALRNRSNHGYPS